MGGFITLNSAAFYGDAYDNFVMLVTSAGSPNSPPPTDQAQEVLVGSNSTPLQTLNTSFPLRYPQGACMCRKDLVMRGVIDLEKVSIYCKRRAQNDKKMAPQQPRTIAAAETACDRWFHPDPVGPSFVNSTTFGRQTAAIFNYVGSLV